MSSTTTRPLTKAQIEYASSRIHQIKCKKLEAFKQSLPALPSAPEVKSYSDKEKIMMISSGVAKLKEQYDTYGYVTNAFKYPDRQLSAADQKKVDALKKAEKANDAATEKFEAELDKRVTNLLDRLHLGDAASTLIMIEAFAVEK
jgi:hypothetical protein